METALFPFCIIQLFLKFSIFNLYYLYSNIIIPKAKLWYKMADASECSMTFYRSESFCKMYLIVACHFIQEPSGSPFCFPCGMGIHIHGGTHVRVS